MKRPILLFAMLLPATQAAAGTDTPSLPGDATSTCGWVTGERPAVPRSQDIFRVEITRIDGDSTPLHPVSRHRVQPGQRVLTVADHIDSHRLPGAAIAQIARMKKLEMQRAYKTFTVDVKPGVSYAIGARLLREHLDAQGIRDNAYWEPVVWDERAERCP